MHLLTLGFLVAVVLLFIYIFTTTGLERIMNIMEDNATKRADELREELRKENEIHT